MSVQGWLESDEHCEWQSGNEVGTDGWTDGRTGHEYMRKEMYIINI